MEDNEQYYRGKYNELETRYEANRHSLEGEITILKWIIGFLVASTIILLIITLVMAGSSQGYSPEQVTDMAIKICKELSLK